MRKKTSRGEETRARINQATLQIIKRDGMRSVRHRAVAKEAEVPLGATTYHFHNIEDLIVSAFSQWREETNVGSNPYISQLMEFLEHRAPGLPDTEEGRITMAREVYRVTLAYEIDQIEGGWDNRVIELAFYHESLHSEKLRQQVIAYWQLELDSLITVFTALRLPDPVADARISQSVFHQLEREAMIKGVDYDRAILESTLHRHICHLMGVEFTP